MAQNLLQGTQLVIIDDAANWQKIDKQSQPSSVTVEIIKY